MPQMQLPFFPSGATHINNNIAFIREEDKITYIHGSLPLFTHDVEDIASFKLIISQIYLNGQAKQSQICRAFGVSAISVKRSVKKLKKDGPAAFFTSPNRRGSAVLTPTVLSTAQQLLDEGKEISDVSEATGVKNDTLRKAVKDGRLHKVKKT